jgi:hypothetical protein
LKHFVTQLEQQLEQQTLALVANSLVHIHLHRAAPECLQTSAAGHLHAPVAHFGNFQTSGAYHQF